MTSPFDDQHGAISDITTKNYLFLCQFDLSVAAAVLGQNSRGDFLVRQSLN
jgi:hypothetical protein